MNTSSGPLDSCGPAPAGRPAAAAESDAAADKALARSKRRVWTAVWEDSTEEICELLRVEQAGADAKASGRHRLQSCDRDGQRSQRLAEEAGCA